jgi:hypothetical protein
MMLLLSCEAVFLRILAPINICLVQKKNLRTHTTNKNLWSAFLFLCCRVDDAMENRLVTNGNANDNPYTLPTDCGHIRMILAPFAATPRWELWFVVLWTPIEQDDDSETTQSKTLYPRLCRQRYMVEMADSSGRPINISRTEETKEYILSMVIGPMEEAKTEEIINMIDTRKQADTKSALRRIATEWKMLMWLEQ